MAPNRTRTTAPNGSVDLAPQVVAQGRSWAETKAERLAGSVAAHDWPDAWEPAWSGPLSFGTRQLADSERSGLEALATRAAAERWRELVCERRDEEDVEDGEVEEEIGALELIRAVAGDLPEGLSVAQDGERVCFRDREGFERTVTSLSQAWRVVAEYEEQRSLRT